MVAQYLLEQYGKPEMIIVSPYRRTRETANVMKSVVENTVPLIIDTDVSEYLGNHRTVPIDVTESTLIHDPPHPETFVEMKARVKKHHNKITSYCKAKERGIIWIVTHGLIIKQVACLIGMKMAKEFPTLSCVSIVDGEKITRSDITIFNENIEIDSDDNDSCEEVMATY
jgi:broad specificity phosphatase PhoE